MPATSVETGVRRPVTVSLDSQSVRFRVGAVEVPCASVGGFSGGEMNAVGAALAGSFQR